MEFMPIHVFTEITPANILYTVAVIFGAVGACANWLQTRHNHKANKIRLEENTALTQKVASSVNGHLDGIKAENEALRNRCIELQLEVVRLQGIQNAAPVVIAAKQDA